MAEYVVVGNLIQKTHTADAKAKCYLLQVGDVAAHILLRSHGGRWILGWQSLKNIHNVRIKPYCEENPEHQRVKKLWFLYDLDGAEDTVKHAKP